MVDHSVSAFIAWAISGLFAVSALVHFAGPGFIRRAYAHWEFPPKFHRVTGVVELLSAAFLAEPTTRIWGVVLAGMVISVAVVTLLKNRQYAWTLPGIVMLVALVPASLSALV